VAPFYWSTKSLPFLVPGPHMPSTVGTSAPPPTNTTVGTASGPWNPLPIELLKYSRHFRLMSLYPPHSPSISQSPQLETSSTLSSTHHLPNRSLPRATANLQHSNSSPVSSPLSPTYHRHHIQLNTDRSTGLRPLPSVATAKRFIIAVNANKKHRDFCKEFVVVPGTKSGDSSNI
jgi:hypothetical protein